MDTEKQRVLDLAHLLMLGEFTRRDYIAVLSEELLVDGYIAWVDDNSSSHMRVTQKGIDLIQGTSLFNKEK